jgi:hypothetical protein
MAKRIGWKRETESTKLKMDDFSSRLWQSQIQNKWLISDHDRLWWGSDWFLSQNGASWSSWFQPPRTMIRIISASKWHPRTRTAGHKVSEKANIFSVFRFICYPHDRSLERNSAPRSASALVLIQLLVAEYRYSANKPMDMFS